MNNLRYNRQGYADPTAYVAITRADLERRRKQLQKENKEKHQNNKKDVKK